MWKILTAQIREEIYFLLTSRGLFPEEQKGCRKGSRGNAELLHSDQHILNESKTRRKTSSYDLDWLQNSIWYGSAKLNNKLPQNVQNITWSHKHYRENHENLESGVDNRRKKLSWSKDPKRYFSRRLLFIIAMMPLNHILRKCSAGYKLCRSYEKINHLMYMDDIKLFAKNEKELKTLIHAVRIYSQDIGMEFGVQNVPCL